MTCTTSLCELTAEIGLSSEEEGLRVAGSEPGEICCVVSVFDSCKNIDKKICIKSLELTTEYICIFVAYLHWETF